VRPLLVSQRLTSEQAYEEIRAALDVRWGEFLTRCGLVPVPVLPGADPGHLLSLLPDCAGLLLTGGNDLATVCKDPLSRARDRHEEALLEQVEAHGLPVLGVCRGLQLLGQRDGCQLVAEEGHVATRHPIQVSADSRWLANLELVEVNSYHGWLLRGEPTSLRVAARDAEGAIEALERAEGSPLLAIMWHPEREAPFQEHDLRLFREFYGGRA
jgi:N5-(cytidine 5'-diphosphoramidyl)-L-glutamine hydrolase